MCAFNYNQINSSYYNDIYESKEERINFARCERILNSLELYSKKLDKLIEKPNTENKKYKD